MEKAAQQVRRTIMEHKLIERGDHIVMGLSGGPDSVCLFHVLLEMADEMELSLHPVHINHQFRPGAAEEDQSYVEELCCSFGLECSSFVVDCNSLAQELGMTSEEAGRKARYDAFFETASRLAESQAEAGSSAEAGAGKDAFGVKIAVAHNAEDQAETVLFRILRGTGTDGLAGMAYEREESRGDESFRVIRPLLDVARADIEEYCRAKGLNPVIDQTNNQELYARNRIRLDLLPYLEEKYNSNIKSSLVRLAAIAAEDKDYFWQESCRVMEQLRLEGDGVILDRAGLAACHPSIRHRIMMKAFGEVGLIRDITAERLAAADEIIMKKQGPKQVEFPHGYLIKVAAGKVAFMKK